MVVEMVANTGCPMLHRPDPSSRPAEMSEDDIFSICRDLIEDDEFSTEADAGKACIVDDSILKMFQLFNDEGDDEPLVWAEVTLIFNDISKSHQSVEVLSVNPPSCTLVNLAGQECLS